MNRVALLITGLEPGGAEHQTVQVAQSLHARGWDVTVFAFRSGPLASDLKAAAVPVHLLGPARLLVELDRLKPAILHAHLFHANLAARLSRLFCPIPVVISTVHSAAESRRRTGSIRHRDLLYRLTDALADATVFVSAAAAERHIAAGAVSPRRATVIPNGVDIARFRPDPDTRARVRAALGLDAGFAWLAAGRLMWKKNYPLMLEAMTRQPNAVLLIAGEGPDANRLQELAGFNVRFLGARPDIAGLMNACDGFVLSSDVEGLPMALLEAAASGLPAVATDVGGVSEVVIDERTGFVVPAGDAGALAAAMCRLSTLPDEARVAMSSAARAHAICRFALDGAIARWEDLYCDLVEAARHNRQVCSFQSRLRSEPRLKGAVFAKRP